MRPVAYIHQLEETQVVKTFLVFKRFLFTYYVVWIPLLVGFLFVQRLQTIMILLALYAIGVASMTPLFFAQWCGFLDMNLMITVFVTMKYGPGAGIVVGTASIVGLVLTGDVENIIVDLIMSHINVIIALFFPLSAFVPVTIAIAVIYLVASLVIHKILGSLEIMNTVWIITHFFWVLFVVTKIVPLFF